MTSAHSEAVAVALESCLDAGEIGVQVAVYVNGELVVDATAGLADTTTGRIAADDTVWPVYSVTKAITATAVNIQVDRGLLDPDAPIASYWPEFAAAGKQSATVLEALTHRVGLPSMPSGATTERTTDWAWVTAELAAMTPEFEPGTTNAYHPASWGWIVGELVRRTDPTQRSLKTYVQDEILEPLDISELWLGLPSEIEPRLARLEGRLAMAGREPEPVGAGGPDPWNDPATWRVGSPSGGALMTARAGGRLFAMLAGGGALDGTRILSRSRVLASLEPRDDALAPDAIAKRVRLVGRGGYWIAGELAGAEPLLADGNRTLWHPGAGGSLGWADLDRNLAVMICHNRLFDWEGRPVADHPYRAIKELVDGLGVSR